MIEHLSEQTVTDQDGCTYAYSAPSNSELMAKINELIDEVNKLKTKLEEEKKDKFDITTLMPFDKVLVRDANDNPWMAAHFSHYQKDAELYYPYFASGSCFKQCIPYEGDEHLLGTTNDCDDYYKTWNDETDE